MTNECRLPLKEYVDLRREQPHFVKARSIRNALDRARLRHANRLFKMHDGKLKPIFLASLKKGILEQVEYFLVV